MAVERSANESRVSSTPAASADRSGVDVHLILFGQHQWGTARAAANNYVCFKFRTNHLYAVIPDKSFSCPMIFRLVQQGCRDNHPVTSVIWTEIVNHKMHVNTPRQRDHLHYGEMHVFPQKHKDRKGTYTMVKSTQWITDTCIALFCPPGSFTCSLPISHSWEVGQASLQVNWPSLPVLQEQYNLVYMGRNGHTLFSTTGVILFQSKKRYSF